MKKLLLILSISFIASCGKDDAVEIEAGLSGTLMFNGNSITISDGLFGELSEDGQYAATFLLSDAPVSYDTENEQASFEGDYLINVVIYAEGDAFEAGNYNVATLDSPIEDKTAFVVVADADNASSGGALAIDGTINIQGSGNEFTLTFAVDFENEVELVGSTSGDFEVVIIPNDEQTLVKPHLNL